MYSDQSRLRHGTRGFSKLGLTALAPLVMLFLVTSACGHKSAPIPPPLRHPAVTKDLVVQQRGDYLILSFGYPQTTVSGTQLEPLEYVEVWELVRPVPDWVPPTASDAGEAEAEAPAEPSSEEPTDASPDVFTRGSGSGDDPSLADDVPVEEQEPEIDQEASELEPGSEAEDDDGDEQPAPVPVRPSDEKLLAVDSNEFAATASLRATFLGPDLTAATFGDRLVFRLAIDYSSPADGESDRVPDDETTPPVEAEGSIFAIKTSVGSRFTSNFSNHAIIAHREAPEPPLGFALEPRADRIVMSWTVDRDAEDEDVVGFNVYRRDAESPSYGPPLGFVPLLPPSAAAVDDAELPEGEAADTREYSDGSAVLGQRYIFALTTVSNRAPVVESAITVEREIDYADRFAPAPPRNLITLPGSGRIQILWDANPEADVAGYIVSRRDADGSFTRLHEDLVTALEFSDQDVQSGRSYAYRVVAVDERGNESMPSAITETRAP